MCSIHSDMIMDRVISLINWLEYKSTLGILIMSCLYALAIVLTLPSVIFTIPIAFLVFQISEKTLGFFLSVLILFIGSSIGAIVSYFMAHFCFREIVRSFMNAEHKTFTALEKAIEKNGMQVVLLIRISPVIPFGLSNYFLGSTEVKFIDYMIGGVGNIPMLCLYAYIGMTIDNISDGVNRMNQDWLWVITLIGGLSLILTVAYISHIARKQLDEVVNCKQLTDSDEETEKGDEISKIFD